MSWLDFRILNITVVDVYIAIVVDIIVKWKLLFLDYCEEKSS